MKRRVLILVLSVFCSLSLFAQKEGVRSMGGVSLGTSTGAFYELRLSESNSFYAYLGLSSAAGFADGHFYYGAFIPQFTLDYRYHFKAKKYTGTNNNGWYVGFGIGVIDPEHPVLPSSSYIKPDNTKLNLLYGPKFGYGRDLTERLSIDASLGLQVSSRYRIRWSERPDRNASISIDLKLSYRI